LWTAARDIVFGDAPELTAVAATLGVAHPPGYPLWTMLGHLFTLLPIGSLPFRVSVFTAVAAVGAVAVVYVTAWRLARSVVAATCAAAMLAIVPVFWTWSVLPEVFSLGALLGAGLIALLLVWHVERRPRWLIGASLVGGLGMANQQTIALLAPAALYLMWIHRRDLSASVLARATLAFLAGLLPYAYLPLAASRDPLWSWSDISSAGDLAAHVLRTSFGTGQLVGNAFLQGGSAVDRLVLFARSFNVAEAVLAAAGAAALYRRDRMAFWTVAIAFLLAGPAFVAYANVRVDLPVTQAALERFFLLPHVVAAPLVAVGMTSIAEWLRPRGAGARMEAAVAAPALAIAIAVAALSFGSIDQGSDRTARNFGDDILKTARRGHVLLANGDAAMMTTAYLSTIEGLRPDVTVVQTPLLMQEWYVRQLRRRHPALVLRAPRYDGTAGTMRDLVEPNGRERFDIAGGLLDDSLARTYGMYRRGLVEELRPLGEPLTAEALAAVNEELLRTYRIPNRSAIAGKPWDVLVLADYAFIAYDVAQAFERQRAYPPAREWYERALAIDPDLVEARTALAKLPR
jgi:hypothetical protein